MGDRCSRRSSGSRASAGCRASSRSTRGRPTGRRSSRSSPARRPSAPTRSGSGTVGGRAGDAPAWLPEVETSEQDEDARRRLFAIDPVSGTSRVVSPPELNVWEAAWCGPATVAAIVSEGGGEADWYGARLSAIDVATGAERVLLRTDVQLGG